MASRCSSLLVAPVVALVLIGCAATTSLVRDRFARERGCPSAEVTVRAVGGDGYRAEGCGKEATYRCGGFAGVRSTVDSSCVESGVRPAPRSETDPPSNDFNVFPAPTAR